MKGFVVSLCVFSLLLGGIILNSFYINSTCEALLQQIDALPDANKAAAPTAALCDAWEHQKSKIRISVSLSTLDKVDAILAELDYAARFGDAVTFERGRALARQAITEIKENEGLTLENWI